MTSYAGNFSLKQKMIFCGLSKMLFTTFLPIMHLFSCVFLLIFYKYIVKICPLLFIALFVRFSIHSFCSLFIPFVLEFFASAHFFSQILAIWDLLFKDKIFSCVHFQCHFWSTFRMVSEGQEIRSIPRKTAVFFLTFLWIMSFGETSAALVFFVHNHKYNFFVHCGALQP